MNNLTQIKLRLFFWHKYITLKGRWYKLKTAFWYSTYPILYPLSYIVGEDALEAFYGRINGKIYQQVEKHIEFGIEKYDTLKKEREEVLR